MHTYPVRAPASRPASRSHNARALVGVSSAHTPPLSDAPAPPQASAQCTTGARADAVDSLTEAVRICGARCRSESGCRAGARARLALPWLVLAETFFAEGDRASAKAEALAALAVAQSEAQRARSERMLTRCAGQMAVLKQNSLSRKPEPL